MIPGFPTSVAIGDPDDIFLVLDRQGNGLGTGEIVTGQAAVEYGETWAAFVCDGRKQEIRYFPEGESVVATVAHDPNREKHVVSIAPLGDWDSDLDIDVTIQQLYFTSDKGQWVTLDFDASIETFEVNGDSGQLSSWSLTGISRFSTSKPYTRRTEAQIDVTLTDVAGTRTVTLKLGDYAIASGSRSGDGAITLTAENSSGVSGSVNVVYTADFTSDAYLVVRWCEKYTVTVGALSVTVNDNGLANRLQAVVGPFDAGTYNWSITPISDTQISGTAATGTVDVPGAPEPPGTPVYSSGDWDDPTVIAFAASDTPGATYRIYDSELGLPTNFDVVAATHIAGSGTLTVNLPALASAGTGIRRVVVESVFGGIESGFRRSVEIEYASGVVILPRPNVPGFALRVNDPVTSGRTLNVEYEYDATDQEGVATHVRLDIRSEAGVVTTGTPQALTPAVNGVSRGTLTATAGADGWYEFIVVALTAAGTASNNATYKEAPPLSNSTPAAVANVTATVIVG